MSFECKYLNTRLKLDKETIELLEQIEAFSYPLLGPKFNTLGELHDTLTVEITDKLDNDGTHIERISIAGIKARIKELKTEQEMIKNKNNELLRKMRETEDSNLRSQLERQMKPFHGDSELGYLLNVLNQNQNRPDDYVVEIKCTTHRLGYYTRTGKDAKIVLEHTGGVYRIISTYIHELMHAFYDSARSGDFPNSIEYVEEPLTEYGMLRFLDAFVQTHPEHRRLLDEAIRTVNEKQHTLGISHYAFGEYLYQNYSHIKWEKLMLDAKDKVDVGSEDYKSLQAIFQTRPDKSNWDKAAQLLYDILAKANGNPSVKIAKQTSKTTTRRKTASPNDSNVPFNIDKATYDIWLKRYQESGILPSEEEMEKAIGKTSAPSAAPKTTGPSKVIVGYEEPYQSFGASYRVYLEYDYDKDSLQYLIKDPLRGLTKTLSDDEIETIKSYLRNRQNIEDFFNKAKDTNPNTRFVHHVVYSMSMKYGGRTKSVSNGGLMPWAEPFAKLCSWY